VIELKLLGFQSNAIGKLAAFEGEAQSRSFIQNCV